MQHGLTCKRISDINPPANSRLIVKTVGELNQQKFQQIIQAIVALLLDEITPQSS